MIKHFFLATLCLLLFISCANKSNSPNNLELNKLETENKHTKSNIADQSQNELKIVFPTYIDLNFVMGKFDPNKRDNFSKISIDYADREGRYMHSEAYEAFIKMHAAAKKDGINLKIKSAARNFDYQKGIWERKWTGATLLEGKENAAAAYQNHTERAIAILKYSSMPGSSRHHWGTDIDINNFTNSYFENGQGKKEFDWLSEHASEFGYCRPYTKIGTDRQSGYQEEKWHWSYIPVADLCTKYAEQNLSNEMISGFLGAEVAKQINIKDNYILGISSSCKN